MVTFERLRELLEYNPESGLWVWIRRDNNRCPPGKIAGAVDKAGYVVIQVDGHIYKAHRLAWLYMTGDWPRGAIDHINLEPGDNRWVNLREATRSQNGMNRRPARNNKSGFKGVCWHKAVNKWYAQIKIGQRVVYLGVFDTKEEAAAVYRARAKEVHGEFYCEQ